MTRQTSTDPVDELRFSKLEALGNDFMLVDARAREFAPEEADVRGWSDRRSGVGFDQILILRPGETGSICRVEIRNADGSEAEQCGNGMRAVALWLKRFDGQATPGRLETAAGPVDVDCADEERIGATLGHPDFSPGSVGVEGVDSFPWTVDVDGESLTVFGASLGNPHLLVIEKDPADASRLSRVGRALGSDPALRRGANVGLASVTGNHRIELRVFERGVGPTMACGSGATAAAAILMQLEAVESPVEVVQPGGTLVVNWPSRDQALSTAGPARHVFEGVLSWPTPPQ